MHRLTTLALVFATACSGEALDAEPRLTRGLRVDLAEPDRKGRIEALLPQIAPLHRKKLPPGPYDWLADQNEPGQTFRQWQLEDPVLPDLEPGTGHRRHLYVQALGPLEASHDRIVTLATDYLERFFGLPVRRRATLSLSLVPREARRRHPVHGDPQILSGFVLDELLAPRLPPDAAAYISFTASDLWPGKGWSFVFGQASLRHRVGVWSVKRYGDPDAGPTSFRRALRRTLKVAVHETSHMFSMRHCTAYECVMNGVNSQAESDRGPLWLCPECLGKVLYATDQDPRERYERLAAFAKVHGLKPEASFFDRAAKLLR